jgi:hypothetical protein
MRFGVHRRKQDGLHIWTCKVYGPQRTGNQLSGYLFLDPKAIFSDVPNNNPFLRLECDRWREKQLGQDSKPTP